MAVMHDYHHVDGDIPLKHMCLVPEYKEISEKWIIEGDWDPFYSELARLTLEGARIMIKSFSLTLRIRMTIVTMSSRSSSKAERMRIRLPSFNSQLIPK